jgi:hypothetical protein
MEIKKSLYATHTFGSKPKKFPRADHILDQGIGHLFKVHALKPGFPSEKA